RRASGESFGVSYLGPYVIRGCDRCDLPGVASDDLGTKELKLSPRVTSWPCPSGKNGAPAGLLHAQLRCCSRRECERRRIQVQRLPCRAREGQVCKAGGCPERPPIEGRR